MQGVADGYFVIPYTIGEYLSDLLNTEPVSTDDVVFTDAVANIEDQTERLLSINGTQSVDHFHRALGKEIIDRKRDL